MISKRTFRRILQAALIPVVVLLSLNLERFYENNGWDTFLTEWGFVGDVIAFLQSPWVQYPAVFVFGAVVFLLIDRRLGAHERDDKSLGAIATIEEPISRAHRTEAERQGLYEGAHEELMLFVVRQVFPTCEAVYKLQDALLRRISGSSTVADMAMSGVRDSYWVQPYAEGMDYLHGLVSSPSEYLYFREMIEAVEKVEKGYRAYVGVAAKLSEEAGIILKDDPELERVYHQWRANHQSMYDAYDRIKIDTRFKIDANLTGLFRPVRKSRWGELVGTSSLSVSSQFLQPEDTPT